LRTLQDMCEISQKHVFIAHKEILSFIINILYLHISGLVQQHDVYYKLFRLAAAQKISLFLHYRK